MIRKFCQLSFATLKPSKAKEIPLSFEQIQKMGSLLNLQTSSMIDMESARKQYFSQRTFKFVTNYDQKEIIKKWKEIRPLECEINILAMSDQYTAAENKYMDFIIKFWGGFFLKHAFEFKQMG